MLLLQPNKGGKILGIDSDLETFKYKECCILYEGLMPGETPPRASNRWEGTHTYKKPEATKRRARTVAQLREEAAAKSKAGRQEAINRRRGSLGGPSLSEERQETPTSGSSTPTGARELPSRRTSLPRRVSTGGLTESATARGPAPPNAGQHSQEEDATRGEESSEEEFKSADEMPGSGKKKRTASGQGDGSQDAAGNGGVDPALVKFLNGMKSELMESTREAVGRIESRLDKTESGLANLEKRVERSEKEVVDKIAAEVTRQVAGGNAVSAPTSKKEASYNFCRRSLKIWPVEGENLEDAVRVFLKNKLGMTDARIRALGAIEVSTPPGRLPRERKEVLATFESRDDRDNVKANGINLAGQRDVGMTLHVPGYLMDDLIALNGIGYSIKQNNPDVKRSVKFDDRKQSLYLDVYVGGKWKKVTPVEAKQVLKEVPTASSAGGSLSVAELASLVKEDSEERSAVVIPDDNMEA